LFALNSSCMIYSVKCCLKNPSPATRQGGENEVSVKANASFTGVMPKLKHPVSVKANASFTGVMPKLKHPVSVKANVGFIDVRRSGRN